MRSRIAFAGILFAILLILPSVFALEGNTDPREGNIDTSISNDVISLYSQSKALFIENKGQWDPSILFVAETSYGKMALARDGIYHLIVLRERVENKDGYDPFPSPEVIVKDSCLVKVLFEGGSPASVRGEDPVETRYNFFLGNDPSRWASDVRGYRSVLYEDVWDGIDILYYQRDGRLKYDIVLNPGSDPDLIGMRIVGASSTRISDDSLMISTPIGVDLLDSGLVSNYESGEIIGSAFSLHDDMYGFDLAPYDRSKKVVIDPVYNVNALNFSTYVGGSDYDFSHQMDQDINGNIVACGETNSLNFPVTIGSYNTTPMGWDSFVYKLDSKGKNLIFCTYLSGSDGASGTSIKVDSFGNIIIAGYTSSNDFPTTSDAYQKERIGSYDIFISKISNSGSSLLSSTYLGGGSYDMDPIIDLDENSNVLITARTESSDFPITSDAFQKSLPTTSPSYSVIVSYMNLSDMKLLYSTFIGGSSSQMANSIKYKSNYLYICGSTTSQDFYATAGSYQTNINGREDGFIMKINISSNVIVYSTYFGGSLKTKIMDIDIDEFGNLYACGYTDCTDLPVTMGAYDTSFNGGASDGFIMSLNPSGNILLFSTYEGGEGEEQLLGLTRDEEGAIHVIGSVSYPYDFPIVSGSFQTKPGRGESDGIYSKMKKDGSDLLYSTFIGGSDHDIVLDILIDSKSDHIILLGQTESSDFPVLTGSFQTAFNGVIDGFIIKLDTQLPPDEPLNFIAEPGDSFVKLHWDQPNIIEGYPILEYKIFRGQNPGNPSLLSSVQNTTFNDTSVKNGVYYYYSIKAVNRIGEGAFSQEIVVRPGKVSDPPYNFRIIASGDKFINLSWNYPLYNGGSEIIGYNLYRYNGTSTTPFLRTFGFQASPYLDGEVTNGVNYHYQLTAINSWGESDPTSMVSATPITFPGHIDEVKAVGGPGYVLLKWDAPGNDGGSPILNYTIFRAVQSGSFARYVTLPAMPRIFNDTGLENGLRYRYKLIALNSEGSGDPTDEVSAVPLDRPSPPTNFEVEAFSNSVKITWGQPLRDGGTPVLGFNIYRAEKSMIWSNIRELDILDESYTDNSVINGRTYTYRMTALNAVGESEHTEEINVTPLGRPGSPMGYNIEAGDRFVLLSWETPLDHGGIPVTGFKVFRGESSQEMGLYATIEGPDHTYNDTKVKNGLTYYYKVAATNAVGDGPFTEAKSARPAGIPSPPSNINVVSGDGYVEISWTSPEDDGGDPVTEVRIYRGLYDNRSSILFKGTLLEGSYKDTDVINGIFYHYSMTAVNKNGESISTHPLSVVPSGLPSVPGNVQIEEGRGHITLSWDPPSNSGGIPLTGYNIYRTSMTNGSVLIGSVNANILEYVDEDIQTGAIYLYRVSALNDNGEGPLSDPVEGILKEETGSYTTIIVAISLLIIIILTVVILIIMIVKKRGSPQQTPDASSPPIPSSIRDPHGEGEIPPSPEDRS